MTGAKPLTDEELANERDFWRVPYVQPDFTSKHHQMMLRYLATIDALRNELEAWEENSGIHDWKERAEIAERQCAAMFTLEQVREIAFEFADANVGADLNEIIDRVRRGGK